MLLVAVPIFQIWNARDVRLILRIGGRWQIACHIVLGRRDRAGIEAHGATDGPDASAHSPGDLTPAEPLPTQFNDGVSV